MSDREDKIRAFFAFELPDSVRRWIAENVIASLMEVPARVKWVEARNIHLTMRFLGEVEHRLLRNLIEVLKSGWESRGSISVNLAEAGYFGRNYPRVIWLGLDGELDKLNEVHDFLEKICVQMGLPRDDKKFAPHITIGRVKSPSHTGQLIARLKKIEIPRQDIKFEKLVLFKSTLTPDGPIYEPLEVLAL